MKRKYCSICKRKLGNMICSHYNFIGVQDIIGICKECSMSVDEQILLLYEDFKNVKEKK